MRQAIRNLDQGPFAAVLGFLGVISGLRGLIDPNVYPVHALLHGWDYVWAVTFLLGGLGIIFGLGSRRQKLDAAGCALFAGGAIVEGLAYVAFLGWRSSSWTTLLILSALAFGAMRRWRHLIRGEVQIWVRLDG